MKKYIAEVKSQLESIAEQGKQIEEILNDMKMEIEDAEREIEDFNEFLRRSGQEEIYKKFVEDLQNYGYPEQEEDTREYDPQERYEAVQY